MSCLNINEVRIAGRLVNDPEMKTTTNGTPVVSFRVAMNRPKRDEQTDEADFATVVAWKQRAEFVSKYFRKGMAIYIEGCLKSRTWDDQSGNKRYALEVLATRISFIDSKKDGSDVEDIPYSFSQTEGNFEEIEGDDDFPF